MEKIAVIRTVLRSIELTSRRCVKFTVHQKIPIPSMSNPTCLRYSYPLTAFSPDSAEIKSQIVAGNAKGRAPLGPRLTHSPIRDPVTMRLRYTNLGSEYISPMPGYKIKREKHKKARILTSPPSLSWPRLSTVCGTTNGQYSLARY